GPFCGFAGYRFESRMMGCATAFEGATLERLGDGPLFTDYRLCYAFAERRHYTLRLRCYKLDPWVEVAEYPALGHGARLIWRLNPDGAFDSILSRDSFEGESQPAVEPLVMERPRDVLCRLQMPVLGE
ncbi:MAG: hypothetical protein HYV36_02040, partial [Lentisphaerae bacterium]|nr:hypothetical protein [Lentisphaerota bacterium]